MKGMEEQKIFEPAKSTYRGIPKMKNMLSESPGHAPESGQAILNTIRPKLPPKGEKLYIGIKGNWYDVTGFVRGGHHPGGDVIHEFIGMDASAHFLAYHDMKVLGKRKPVGTYEWDPERPGGDSAEGTWFKLHDQFERMGLFKPDYLYLASRVSLTLFFFAMMSVCIYFYNLNGNNLVYILGTCFLGFAWQQIGFLLHDFMHNQHFHNRKIDQACGWVCGALIGMSAYWWRDEHHEHHLFTNTALEGLGRTDPQMGVDYIWVQDKMLLQFNDLPELWLKFQHNIFLPGVQFVAPYLIKLDVWKIERRGSELLALGVHLALMYLLVSFFQTTFQGVAFILLAVLHEGFLFLLLLVSHYATPYADKEETKKTGHWARRQLEAVIDVDCPRGFDWLFGGLDLHAAHHLFPRMSRGHFRKVTPILREAFTKDGIECRHLSFFGILKATIEKIRQTGLYGLEQSKNKQTKEKGSIPVGMYVAFGIGALFYVSFPVISYYLLPYAFFVAFLTLDVCATGTALYLYFTSK